MTESRSKRVLNPRSAGRAGRVGSPCGAAGAGAPHSSSGPLVARGAWGGAPLVQTG